MTSAGWTLSAEMLSKLKEKAPNAEVLQEDIIWNIIPKKSMIIFFISSGSVSLFTNMDGCKRILQKMKDLLKKGGRFVFAVDTVANRCPG